MLAAAACGGDDDKSATGCAALGTSNAEYGACAFVEALTAARAAGKTDGRGISLFVEDRQPSMWIGSARFGAVFNQATLYGRYAGTFESDVASPLYDPTRTPAGVFDKLVVESRGFMGGTKPGVCVPFVRGAVQIKAVTGQTRSLPFERMVQVNGAWTMLALAKLDELGQGPLTCP